MEGLNKLELSVENMQGLPLFFKKIYHNEVTNIYDESKLFKYNPKMQSHYMRHFEPNRIICKSFHYQKDNSHENVDK